MARILILAERNELLEFVGYVLTKEGHHVRFLHNLGLLVSKMKSLLPELVIIDAASLPTTIDDLQVLVRHRHAHRVRTLILETPSDDADGERSAIKADSYLQRPLNPSSLVTRVQVLLAKESIRSPADGCPPGQIIVADLVIDPNSFQVTRSGRRLSLSLSQFRLLYFLASNPNMVFRRNHLLKIALENRATRPRTVDGLVQHLREQIEENPKKPRFIQSVRAQGFIFRTLTEPSPNAPANSTCTELNPEARAITWERFRRRRGVRRNRQSHSSP
jgi:DNA-binding response OmpR family regulator